ncbi:DUF6292 family protein [Amycolatopsis benzoatilytica]|uniref:DUF6292 family protein n=1 Tax=Amycolatopsis benzoatilytica TaxID=346045 RepID=UPI0003A7085C|nr:DUF6292 family protein [Amycolatopsis benzoatilytica]
MSLIRKPEFPAEDERALAAYVRAVGQALGVPAADTASEVTDLVCGHVFLTSLRPGHPARELVLLWDDTNGWRLARETGPAGGLRVVAAFSGELYPDPAAVAAFVHRAPFDRECTG